MSASSPQAPSPPTKPHSPISPSPSPTPRNHPRFDILTFSPDHDLTEHIDYTPNPANSVAVGPGRQHIIDAVTALYSGSASKTDMSIYAENAVYDDPLGHCDDK